MAEYQMGAKLGGERPHRVILPTGAHAQSAIALPACFRDQTLEQNAADTSAPDTWFDAEGDLGQAIRGLPRRMQFGRAANRAVFHIGHDDGAVVRASLGITLDETVIQKAVESIAAAVRIEPQKVIAQQRQFLMLAEGSHIAKAGPRTERIVVWHVKSSSWLPSRR